MEDLSGAVIRSLWGGWGRGNRRIPQEGAQTPNKFRENCASKRTLDARSRIYRDDFQNRVQY